MDNKSTHLTPRWHWHYLAWGSPMWCCAETSWPRAPGGPGQAGSSGTRRGRPGPGQPWWPAQKYRCPWGFAEMESQPPAPGTDTDYLLNEGENCWCKQNMWFRIKYSHIIKFPIWIFFEKNLNVVDSICLGLSNTCWTLTNSKSKILYTSCSVNEMAVMTPFSFPLN